MDSGWVDGWTDDADPLGMKLYLKHGSTQNGILWERCAAQQESLKETEGSSAY